MDNQKLLGSLSQNSEILSQLETVEELEEFCEILLKKLNQINLQTSNPLVLNYLTNNILGTILCLIKENYLPDKILKLVEFLDEKGLLNEVYKVIFKKIYFESLDKKFENQIINKKEDEEMEKNFNLNLDILLNLDSRAERYINKNFGYSLVDLNGDIIWCDKNSEKFFEINQKKTENKNIFNLMIPFSIHQIFKKFCIKNGNLYELFEKDNKNLGKSIAFSYIVYSKDNLSKYIKHLKKKNITEFDKIKDINNKKDNSKNIYYKYLKALSSKATLIVLKFTKNEFAEILKNIKFKIEVTNCLHKIIDDFERNKINNELELRKTNGFKRKVYKDDVIYKMAILLETRFSKNVPNFDFQKMQSDKKIIEFENIVREKIKKKNK